MSDPINVVNPQGELVSIDPADLKQAVEQDGFRPATPGDVQHAQDAQTYGEGILNPVKAGLAGAARGATLGLSDQALVKSKLVAPATLKGLQEHNPVSSIGGEAIGIIAPALIGDEAGMPGLVTKVGKSATQAAEGILGKTGAKALGSAVEGAFYGAGSVVTEDALGDPNLTAQSALSQIGITSLLTGGLGGILGLATKELPEGITAAKKAILGVEDIARGTEEALSKPGFLEKAYAKASSVVSGKPEESILEALANRHKSSLSKEEKAVLGNDFAKAVNEQYKSLEKALGDSFKDVRAIESEKFLSDAVPEKVTEALTSVKSSVDDLILKMEQAPELYPSHFSKKLEMFREGLERDAVGEKEQIFKALDQFKKNIDTKIKFGKIPASNELDAINDIKGLRSSLKGVLESEEHFSKAGARQAAFNDATHEYLTAKEEFQKKFMTKAKGKGGGVVYKVDPVKVNTFLNQIADPRGQSKAAILEAYNGASRKVLDQLEQTYKVVPERGFDRGAIESLVEKNEKHTLKATQQAQVDANMKAINSMGGSIGEGISLGVAATNPLLAPVVGAYNLLRNPSLTVQRLAALEKNAKRVSDTINKGIGRLTSVAEKSEAKEAKVIDMADMRASYRKNTDKIKELAGNPEQLMDNMSRSTEGINDHAPNVAQAMNASAAAGLAFLSGKLPEVPTKTPFQPEWEPSATEISKFNRYYDIIEKPLNILKHAENGSLTPEHIEAINAVYPALYTHIKTSTLEHIVNHPNKKLPYRSQLMVSMLLGQNVMPSLAPSALLANQATLNRPIGQPSQQNAPSSRNNPSKLTLSNRSQTPLQSTIVRTSK